MGDDLIRRGILIPNIKAYVNVFDSDWATAELKKVRGTPFEQAFFDLMYAWRGASYVRQTSAMSVRAVASSSETVIRASFEHLANLLIASKERIYIVTAREPLTRTQRSMIENDLPVLRAQLMDTIRKTVKIDGNELWNRIISDPDMGLSVGKSEELVYLSLYYAYEVFLTRCVGVKLNQVDFRWSRASEFEESLAKAFGDSVAASCWQDSAIRKARLVRNAVVHNGNRMTRELEPFREELHVDNEIISIAADETTELAETLRIAVSHVLASAI